MVRCAGVVFVSGCMYGDGVLIGLGMQGLKGQVVCGVEKKFGVLIRMWCGSGFRLLDSELEGS